LFSLSRPGPARYPYHWPALMVTALLAFFLVAVLGWWLSASIEKSTVLSVIYDPIGSFAAGWHQIATYASMGVLAVLGYWFMALFILLLSSRSQDARPLDDISPLTKNRKKMFIVVIILGVLCAPLPSGILP